MNELWLDAEQSGGSFELKLEDKATFSAGDYGAFYLSPVDVMCMAPIYLTGVLPREADCKNFASLEIILGCTIVASVELGQTVREVEPYPMRIWVPPRQNLTMRVMRDVNGATAMKLRCDWRRG